MLIMLKMRLFPISFMTVLLLAMTTLVANAQASYPKKVVAQYIEDCTAGRGTQARAVCTCIINGIQSKYTYEEFQILNSQISQVGNVPARLNNIIRACKANPNSFQVQLRRIKKSSAFNAVQA
jgi:type IV secretory pathway VirB2 component (pilin)